MAPGIYSGSPDYPVDRTIPSTDQGGPRLGSPLAPSSRASTARDDPTTRSSAGARRPTLDPPTRRVFRAFWRAVGLAEPVQAELVRRYGVSVADLRGVRALNRLGDLPISRLGAELGLARSTTTDLVDRLESAGLVARRPDPTDRRVTVATITDRGRDALADVAVFRESDVARRLAALDDDRKARLAELLELLVGARPR